MTDKLQRVRVRFVTLNPLHDEPVESGALLVYDVGLVELFKALGCIRSRYRSRLKPHLTPGGYLLNDGTVLAIELARSLPPDPIGRVSLAGPNDAADAELEIRSDMGRETLHWEYFLDGEPVDEEGKAPAPVLVPVGMLAAPADRRLVSLSILGILR